VNQSHQLVSAILALTAVIGRFAMKAGRMVELPDAVFFRLPDLPVALAQ
jgi:hypothetical protein